MLYITIYGMTRNGLPLLAISFSFISEYFTYEDN